MSDADTNAKRAARSAAFLLSISALRFHLRRDREAGEVVDVPLLYPLEPQLAAERRVVVAVGLFGEGATRRFSTASAARIGAC